MWLIFDRWMSVHGWMGTSKSGVVGGYGNGLMYG